MNALVEFAEDRLVDAMLRRGRSIVWSATAVVALVVAIAAHAMLLSGCGGVPRPARLGVEQLAEGINVADRAVEAQVARRGPEARAQVRLEAASGEVIESDVVDGVIDTIEEGLARFEELMEPTSVARSALRTAREALESIEAGLDAWDAGVDEGGTFFEAASCGVVSLLEAAAALQEAGVPLPDELTKGIALIQGFVRGACPQPQPEGAR